MTDAVLLALQVAELNAQSVASHVRFERLKWGVQQLPEPRFPIIIGSDLVYDTSLFEVLDECLRQHLAPQGRVYLSEPHRHTGDSFAKWIRQAGWETQEHDLDMQDGRIPVRVFECGLPL